MSRLLLVAALLVSAHLVDYKIIEKRGTDPQVELRMSDNTVRRMDYIQFLQVPIGSITPIVNRVN